MSTNWVWPKSSNVGVKFCVVGEMFVVTVFFITYSDASATKYRWWETVNVCVKSVVNKYSSSAVLDRSATDL